MTSRRSREFDFCDAWECYYKQSYICTFNQDVVAGGTESRSLEPSGESREGGGGGEYEKGDEPSLIWGVRASPGFFLKSMYLRTHFKPF